MSFWPQIGVIETHLFDPQVYNEVCLCDHALLAFLDLQLSSCQFVVACPFGSSQSKIQARWWAVALFSESLSDGRRTKSCLEEVWL